ncbi:MAG: HAMP domain-containing protein [Vallitaleaceae bacterium]|nr:HAMP domain-containing protein [Vallitaleaceae bacterium]
MRWFMNMKIAVKLISAFIVVAFIAGVIGAVGFVNVNQIGEESLPSVRFLLEIIDDFDAVTAKDNMLLSSKLSYDERNSLYVEITTLESKLISDIGSFMEYQLTAEQAQQWVEAKKDLDIWLEDHTTYINMSKNMDAVGIDDPGYIRYEIALKQKDHYSWIGTLTKDILNKRTFTGKLDGTECALGVWIDGYEPRSTEMVQKIDEMREAHLAVHNSAKSINDVMKSDSITKVEDAIEIYDNKTVYNMDIVLEKLNEMDLIAKSADDAFNAMVEQSLLENSNSNNSAKASLEELTELIVSEADRDVASSKMIIIILAIAGTFVAILLGTFISRLIKKPISDLVSVAEEIKNGNLRVAIKLNTKDELGDLANSFREMTTNMNEVMTNINSASEQVASGSRQVSDSSMSLSQGATEQASSIEELTASIEEIATQTRQNASSAAKAKEMATAAQQFAEVGNTQMIDMLSAMNEINESSNNINRIIKVIDDIAFQTNILALNAAVEAARAGQHGKGFAVVAEEVRTLAARSASAAKDTTTLIEGSIKKVEGGSKIAHETAEALNKIVDGISQVTELVGKIATSSQEQALGVDQVNQGILQISDVVQTTSATAEETAAASEELSGQAELLKSQVATFKLKR